MARLTVSELDLMRGVAANYAAIASEQTQDIPTWANEHLKLPRGTGAAQYDDRLTPYWREPLALVRERILGEGPGARTERITIVCATQVGKTWGLLAPTLAWIAANHPRDIGIVLPTHDTARSFAQTKLIGLFDKSPRLDRLLPSGRGAREDRLGSKAWDLDLMHLHFLNGSVAQDLRRLDLPVLLPDEFDALPQSVQSAKKGEGEGSPIGMMRDRQKTFPVDRLWLGTTTCTTVASHGWQLLCAGSHERLHIACPHCRAHHWLDHAQLKPLSDDFSADQLQIDDAVHWHCPTCKTGFGTDDVQHLVLAACAVRGFTAAAGGWVPGVWSQDTDGTGRWKPNALRADDGTLHTIASPSDIHRSFWLNALYSHFITLGEFLANERRAQSGSQDDQQAHVNGWEANPWTVKAAAATAEQIADLADGTRGYQRGQSPFPCRRLVLTIDQQGIVAEKSWFPWVLRAWDGPDSAKVDAGIAEGFAALTALTKRTWPVAGEVRPIDASAIDSANGPMQKAIREWCAADPERRFSILGSGTMAPGNPYALIEANTLEKRKRLHGLARAWVWNQPWFADLLFAHMQHLEGSGLWRIPGDAEKFYLDSLTSEERKEETVVIRGRRKVVGRWVTREVPRLDGQLEYRTDNHWLDCERMQLVVMVTQGWLHGDRENISPVSLDSLFGGGGGRQRRW